MTQWHPIFGDLLRHALKDYYDVQTNVPVGDLPREADIILLQRASASKPPFRTLWSHLSRWNILEFKGRSESARVGDIDLLTEVGLGIHRRLQEKEPNEPIARSQVSFWYLANRLGKRFLRDVIEFTGNVEAISPGLWRGRILGRPLWLVSNRDIPNDRESIAVHLVSEQSLEQSRELAKVLAADEELWQSYSQWFANLHPELLQEIATMGRKRKRGEIDFMAGLELCGGLKRVVRDTTPKQLLEDGVAKEITDKIGIDGLMSILTPDQLRELAKRVEATQK